MNYDSDATLDQPLPQWPQSRSARRARETCHFADVVQQLVTPLLRDGYPDIQSVAKMLGLSPRTLQRRLSEEGVTYARVVARARCDVAQRMLDDPACKVIELALDLGYSDQAHFARAFLRWTGLTPGEFRRARPTGYRGGELPDENALIAECARPSGANSVDIKVRPEPPRRTRHGGFACSHRGTLQRSGQETPHRHTDAG